MPSKTKSSSKSSSSKKGDQKRPAPESISKDQLTRLLHDVEKLNLPRDKIVLNDVMETDKKYYKPRKSLARGFQKKWDLALRRTAQGYVKLLFQHDVEPSECTQKELEEAEKADALSTDEEQLEDEECDYLTGSELSDEDDEGTTFSIKDLVTNVSSMSIGSPSLGSMKKQAMKTPTPKKREMNKKSVGSASNPFVWEVNSEYPEKNGPVTLQFVSKKKVVESFSAHAYMFVAAMSVPDYPLWKIRQVDECSLLLTKPSQSFWERQSNEYLKKVTCEATKKAFGETKNAIAEKENEHRQQEHHKYVFPVPLDNNLFSDSNREQEHEVTKTAVPMQLVPEGMSKDIKGVVALWTIGVKGSKSKDGDTKAKSTDLDSLIVWQHIAVTKCSKRKCSEHSKTIVNEVKTTVAGTWLPIIHFTQ